MCFTLTFLVRESYKNEIFHCFKNNFIILSVSQTQSQQSDRSEPEGESSLGKKNDIIASQLDLECIFNVTIIVKYFLVSGSSLEHIVAEIASMGFPRDQVY